MTVKLGKAKLFDMAGLHELKRRRTVQHVQNVALDLFDEHGFSSVTIEQIAAEAEVSPSTVYRHFGTKEGLIVRDEYDDEIKLRLDAILRHPDPVGSVGLLVQGLEAQLAAGNERARRRVAWIFSEPSVRLACYAYADEVSDRMSSNLITHHGVDPMAAHVLAHATVFGFFAAFEQWHADGAQQPLSQVVDETIGIIAAILRPVFRRDQE